MTIEDSGQQPPSGPEPDPHGRTPPIGPDHADPRQPGDEPPADNRNEPPATTRPSIRALLAENMINGIRELPPRKRFVAVAAIVALGVGATVSTSLIGFFVSLFGVEQQAEAQRDAERDLDLKKPPFTVTVDQDTSIPQFGQIVLDRTLSSEEQAALRRIAVDDNTLENAWKLLQPLGGRLLRQPPSFTRNPPPKHNFELAHWSVTTAYHINIFSDRKSPLVITRMQPVNILCRPSTARTVVDIYPQGESTYSGVFVDLTGGDPTPYVSDDADDQGRPYFERRKIDLGEGMGPAGIRLEAMVRDQSCDWEFEASYRDSQTTDGKAIVTNGSKPFHAEAVPVRPEQHWTVDMVKGFVPCHEPTTNSRCELRRDVFR